MRSGQNKYGVLCTYLCTVCWILCCMWDRVRRLHGCVGMWMWMWIWVECVNDDPIPDADSDSDSDSPILYICLVRSIAFRILYAHTYDAWWDHVPYPLGLGMVCMFRVTIHSQHYQPRAHSTYRYSAVPLYPCIIVHTYSELYMYSTPYGKKKRERDRFMAEYSP